MALYTQDQLAHFLGVTTRTLAKNVKAGKIPAPIKVGGSNRWTSEQIENWLRQKTETSVA